MSEGSSENLFANVRAIAQELTLSWPGTPVIGMWNYRVSLSAWPMSVQPTGSSDIFDYFLVELNGQSSLGGMEDRSVVGYQLNIDFYQPPHFDAPPPGLELIASSPDTTNATVSYTASVSTTVGGSVGFMGEAPTASVSASVTMSNSTTRSVSDLTIVNRSGVEDNLTCSWQYKVTPGSNEASGTTPLLAQFLVRRPHTADPLKCNVEVSAYFNDDGSLAGRNVPASGPGSFMTFAGQTDPQLLEIGNARMDNIHSIELAAPPAPRT